MKKSIVFAWLGILIVGIVSLFWYNDWRYSLPTPVPGNHINVNLGDSVDMPRSLATYAGKPTLLHFFNPDCPCSRFNIPHFRSLVKNYGNDVTFVIVPLTQPGRKISVEEVQDKFDLDIPVVFDSSLVTLLGVYSTPQAVIINSHHRLYYRGNYNRSRYCTDEKSNYAQMALDAVLQETRNPNFDPIALKAYGCQITMCSK